MSQARKALINSPDTVVCEAIEGLVSATPHLARLDGFPAIKVVVDTTHDKSRVAIVSGGGSGHEPAMAGYVGAGMLAAAVCGEVFASPSEDAVLAAIRAVTGPAGCLLVVMNYTGDRLNFGAAAERAKAEGLRVELVVTADDCAIKSKLLVGRRGIAGTVLVHKVAGAAAAAGGSLEEVKAAAEEACASIGTIGASLTECTLFGHAPNNRLGAEEFELGLGIHGEPGASRAKLRHVLLRPLSGIVNDMISRIAAESGSYLPIPKGGRVVLLLNNLGSTTPLEMHAAAHAAAQLVDIQLQARVERLYCGPFMSSLDMHGLSLTLMRVTDDRLLAALDAPTQAPAWPSTRALYSYCKQPLPLPTGATDEPAVAAASTGASTEQGRRLQQCMAAVCQALLAAKAELDDLDAKIGDGDCGSTLAQGAAAIHQQLAALPWDDPALAVLALAGTLGRSMGGTSGAVYKILLNAIGASLKRHLQGQQLTLASAAAALVDGAAAVSKYGGAQQGSRTMLDALIPASQALKEAAAAGQPAPQAAAAAAAAAEAGAEATKSMVAAAAGRSSYVPAEALAGNADPGAKAVAAWLRAAAHAL